MNLFSNFFNDLGYILTPRNIRLRDLEESRMDITESTNNTMDVNVDEEETSADDTISGGEVFHIPGNHYNNSNTIWAVFIFYKLSKKIHKKD